MADMSTWILLRGLTRASRHWGGFSLQLKEAFPEALVVALDLPGNGELNAMTSPTDIQGMASHCQEAVVELGLAPPYFLVAMSMGGMVAAAWAQARPGDIQGCVLINTSFGHFSPPHHRLRPRAWPSLLGIILDRSEASREQRILDLTSGMAKARAEVVQDWTTLARSRPVSPRNAFRQLLASASFRAPRGAPVPTLVLASAGDQLVDPRCSIRIARHWNCALALHPDAGHDLTLDDGAWVASTIRAWLDGSGPFRTP
jgi:pimeloyl-ACP methyl ester carboxylesterase